MPDISSDLSHARDNSTPPQAVFGLWRRSAEGELRVCLELEVGSTHQVSLKIVPETGCISELSFQKLSGTENTEGLPNFCLKNINPFSSQKCIRELLFFKAGEELAFKEKLKEILTTLLFVTEADQFDANPNVIQARVKFGYNRQAIVALKQAENLPAQVGIDLVENIFESGDYQLVRTFINGLSAFDANARKQVLTRMAQLATEYGEEDRIYEAIWNPTHKPRNTMPVDLSESMNKALAEILIRGFFKNGDRSQSTNAFCAFVASFKYLTQQERITLSNYLVEQGLANDRMELIRHCLYSAERAHNKVNRPLQLQMNMHMHDLGVQIFDDLELVDVGDAEEEPNANDDERKTNVKCLEGISQENALQLLRKGGCSEVLTAPSCFVPLDSRLVAHTIVEAGQISTLIYNLHLFNGLGVALALQVVQAGFAERLLTALKSFELGQVEMAEVIWQVAEAKQVPALLNHLYKLPESALRLIEDELHLLGYRKAIGINSVRIYERYKQLKLDADEEGLDKLCSDIDGLVDQVISAKSQDARITLQEYYADVVGHVYKLHTSYAQFSSNEKCEDRSFDLTRFKIRDTYRVSLKEGTLMTLRPGVEADRAAHKRLEKMIYPLKAQFCVDGMTKEEMQKALSQRIQELCPRLPAYFVSIKEKIYGAILEGLCGGCDLASLKQLLVLYKFIEIDNHQQFVRGSIDTAKKSKNAEYSMLLQLREFFQDQLAESINTVLEEARASHRVDQIMPIYAKRFAKLEGLQLRQDELNKLNSRQFGLTAKFHDSVAAILNNKEMGALIDMETGVVVPQSRKAIVLSKLIGTEQAKIARALKVMGESDKEMNDINLSEFNFDSTASIDKAQTQTVDIKAAIFSLNSKVKKLFANELATIDRELRKYRAATPTSRRVLDLDCYITKNHTSAHARGVGGVCVAGDNPDYMKDKKASQWSMPNFLQLVLKDTLTKKCEGLVLLHYYEDQGKKILTASFNPTSTYLFQVNEADLFKGLLECLIQFAKDNSIDIIACSNSTQIRTNRTGGAFEIALNSRISKVAKRFELSQAQVFSYDPAYKQKTLDILWENAET